MSSQLSAEQLKRIEENRNRALKRKLDLSRERSAPHGSPSKKRPAASVFVSDKSVQYTSIDDKTFSITFKYNPSVVNVCKEIPSRNYDASSKSWTFSSKHFSLICQKLKAVNYVVKDSKTGLECSGSPQLAALNAVLNSDSSPEKSSGSGSSKVFNCKGYCCLVSRDRFTVEMPYHVACVGVFKTMPSRCYNVNSRVWDFSLSDYNALIKALNSVAGVTIEPLPKIVLKIFKNKINPMFTVINNFEESSSKADLANIEDHIVSALMPFQREGVEFAISKKGRILLADDMGLGKTVQSICIAANYAHKWPLLVICPSSVKLMWKDAIVRWLPSTVRDDDVFVVYTGKDGNMLKLIEKKITIISYDLLAKPKMKASLNQLFYRVAIVDESHFIKNFKTARFAAVRSVLKGAEHVILLSGTPALSKPVELFTQLQLIDPINFKDHHQFGVRYCAGIKNNFGWNYSGSSNMAELRIILEETVMLRRTKASVLKQLPPKVRQSVVLNIRQSDLSAEQKDMFKDAKKAIQKEGLTGCEKHGMLLEFFRETAQIKMNAVKSYVLDLVEGDHKFLVFAHHRILLDAVHNELVKKKVEFIRIDGSTSSTKREEAVKTFQQKSSCKVALLSITAANMGITLNAASLVVFGELFWNPGILVQAEDRCYRIGQRDMVNVHYLLAKGTSDDYVWHMIKEKLGVLEKAGLNENTFDDCENHEIPAAPEQSNTLLNYYSPKDNSVEAVTKKDQPSCSSHTSSPSKQKKLLDYFTPTKEVLSEVNSTEFQTAGTGITDDDIHLLLNDDDFDFA